MAHWREIENELFIRTCLCDGEKWDKLSSESGGLQKETDTKMTVDFIRSAQEARVNALTEKGNRDLELGADRKVRRLPPLTQCNIDALFQTSAEATDIKTGSLAA